MLDAPAAGVAVVTGGLRGLGARVARWLLDAGRARRVVLVGRSEPAAGSAAARDVDELVARGAEVRRCDVSDAEQVAWLGLGLGLAFALGLGLGLGSGLRLRLGCST